MDFIDGGGLDAVIDEDRADELLDGMLERLRLRRPLKRVLLVPPDITRFHSWAGPLTCLLYQKLHDQASVAILPAVGTHAPMTGAEIERMYPGVPRSAFHGHDWRRGVVPLGEVPASLIREVSEG